MFSSRALPSPGVRYQRARDRHFIRARRRAAPSAVTCSIAAAAAPSPSPRPLLPPLHQTKNKACRATAASPSPSPSPPPPPPPPLLLLQTKDKACLTTAIEAGRLTAAVFSEEARELARQWRKLARFEALLLLSDEKGGGGSMVPLNDDENDGPPTTATVVGRWAKVPDAGALRQAEASLSTVDPGLRYVVMDSLSSSSTTTWRIIPAENLVAFAQQQPWWRRSKTRLLATAATSADVGALLGSLEAGTDGVVLVTDDPSEVRAACLELERRVRASSPPLLRSVASPSPSPDNDHPNRNHPVYEEAVVTRVDPVGMADRACVDLASALQPGEGLLVGCFARALFLVHSERDETSYIAARPFRVNAGPLAQYVLAEGPSSGSNGGGGRTAYLSELRCGRTVAVAGADGRLAEAEAVVARVKVERRPVVLVEAETPGDGQRHSVLLQNAETVKLVGPSLLASSGQGDEENPQFWRAVSVAQLSPGDRVYVLRQPAARHTGLAIDEGVSER